MESHNTSVATLQTELKSFNTTQSTLKATQVKLVDTESQLVEAKTRVLDLGAEVECLKHARAEVLGRLRDAFGEMRKVQVDTLTEFDEKVCVL